MNDIDKIYNDAVANVWEIYRGAMFNHIYHEQMAAHYKTIASILNIATPVLIVLGVVISMWREPIAETASEWRKRITIGHMVAFLMAVAAIVTWQKTPDGPLKEHEVLSKQWLAMIGQSDSIRTTLRDMKASDPVSAELLAKIDILKDESSVLLQGETDPTNDTYVQLAKVVSRQRIYGEHVLTKQDAINEFEKRKKEGRIPSRDSAAKKDIIPNKAKPTS